jgi:hypothetical protein
VKKNDPELRPDEPLSRLIEAARNESPKDAIRCLKRARRAIKRELCRVKKHWKRFPMSAWYLEALKKAPLRQVQVVNAHPGILAAGNQPASGFSFCPPDPSVVRELLVADAPCEASGATEDVSAPDAVGGGDVLILANRESSSLIPRS